MAPRGRPPSGFAWHEGSGTWVNEDTGEPLDRAALVAEQRKRDLTCMRNYYWKPGGLRDKRMEARALQRQAELETAHTCKLRQLTLWGERASVSLASPARGCT